LGVFSPPLPGRGLDDGRNNPASHGLGPLPVGYDTMGPADFDRSGRPGALTMAGPAMGPLLQVCWSAQMRSTLVTGSVGCYSYGNIRRAPPFLRGQWSSDRVAGSSEGLGVEPTGRWLAEFLGSFMLFLLGVALRAARRPAGACVGLEI